MARIVQLPLPSGLVITLRNMTVREEDLLADPSAQRDPLVLDRVLEAVVDDVDDVPAFYPRMGASGSFKAPEALTGDRMAALYYLRRLTYGDIFDFDWHCSRCRARNDWEGDLAMLVVKDLPAESKEILLGDGLFRRTLPDVGDAVAFRLTRGTDEARLTKLRKTKKGKLSTALMMFRLVEINGAKPTDNAIGDWPSDDAAWLRNEWDLVDCGIDTTVELDCGDCGAGAKIELPFGLSLFTRPKRRLRRIGLRPDEMKGTTGEIQVLSPVTQPGPAESTGAPSTSAGTMQPKREAVTGT